MEKILSDFLEMVTVDAISFDERKVADICLRKLEELGCTVSNLFLPPCTHLPPASGFVLLRACLQIPRCPRSAFCSFHLHSCACVLPFLQDRSTQKTYPKPLHGALTHDSRS